MEAKEHGKGSRVRTEEQGKESEAAKEQVKESKVQVKEPGIGSWAAYVEEMERERH